MSKERRPRRSSKGARDFSACRSVIVKIGSKALASEANIYRALARDVRAAHEARTRVVLVSSGAIALGLGKLGLKTRPKDVAKLQAAAAAGQSLLMRAYEEAFSAQGLKVAQVLLTHADLAHRARANNARAALSALLDAGVVPIINENDSVAIEEIKFGDNDQLSAMLSPLVDADLLLLLSDVDGLLDADGVRVPMIRSVRDEALPLIRSGKSDVGTGGMGSKVEAARKATLAGAHVVIADARREGIVGDVLAGRDVGTWFHRAEQRLSARRHWITFTLKPRGDLILDAGCIKAVRSRGVSVLSVGVLGVRGTFQVDDAVRLLDSEGREVARGISRFSVSESARLAGGGGEVLVHRDDLVLTD
jgi:glutamate 5-kinase